MFHIVLFQPEIPPNTGNIIRLCANTGAQLHLIHPLGFALGDKEVKRAGLDYHEYAKIQQYPDYAAFVAQAPIKRLFAFSTRGSTCYADTEFQEGDGFIFGPETRGLPKELLESLPTSQRLRIPMLPHSRSLNLSNTAALVLYEAWRQHGFPSGI